MNIELESTKTADRPSIWGLWPEDVHQCYWASLGVQVLTLGGQTRIEPRAKMYLLTMTDEFVNFRLSRLANLLTWTRPKTVLIGLTDEREPGMREFTVTDEALQLQRFERVYQLPDNPTTRVALTLDAAVAERWSSSETSEDPWSELEKMVPASRWASTTVSGRVYASSSRDEVAGFIRDLVERWNKPGITIDRARRVGEGIWADDGAHIQEEARFVGPIWIGAGRIIEPDAGVVGPTVLWDDPNARPDKPELLWPDASSDDHQSALMLSGRPKPVGYTFKRTLDVIGALIGLILTLPLYPIIMLLIWLEDGAPFFFSHRRQTFGGSEFPCLKFRTMRKDAEEIKARLEAENQADGPQFFIENDPRILKIGNILRRTNLDEIPQFFNVLLGHMSMIGPRPSPHKENQYCPEWRNARLSVRPGITGLWQVKRTRSEGEDFQEWIRFDIEYVEKCNFKLDMWILWKTFRNMIGNDNEGE